MIRGVLVSQGFSDRHFERGEGPGDEVVALHILTAQDLLRHLRML